MARGDGNFNRIVMIGGLHLPFIEPLFPEESFETRGDGFVPRRIVPLVQNNNRPEEPNQAERLMPVLEQDAENEPENDPPQPAEPEPPLEPPEQPENFLLYDYESENSDMQESGHEDLDIEDSELEQDGCEDAQKEVELNENTGH